MFGSIIICFVAFVVLVWHSRLVKVSLGLPVAYLFSMLLQHLPGGFAHWVDELYFSDSSMTEFGLNLTAVGTTCFVGGVILMQRRARKVSSLVDWSWLGHAETKRFSLFCLLFGWIIAFFSTFFRDVPSLGAAVEKGGAIWILGVLIGILSAAYATDYRRLTAWTVALSVYPLLVLIRAGFLSFGSTSVFVVLAAMLVSQRSALRMYGGMIAFSVMCFIVFLSYFQNRDSIRDAAWRGGSLEQRIQRSTRVITDLAWFDPFNYDHLNALDQRLNQNQFVGMAAQNIESGHVDFLYGRSVWDGLRALVPRAIWPDKPVFAGSSQMIREMAGFAVNESTSYGVGQVMEFYVNYGTVGVAIGFVLFGIVYGYVDQQAAYALHRRDFGKLILWFLPAVAMNAPLASIAEIMGGVAAAAVGAAAWRHAWQSRHPHQTSEPGLGPQDN